MYSLTAEPLALGSLANAVSQGSLPMHWTHPPVLGAAEWAQRVADVKRESSGSWYHTMAGAFAASGAALERLRAAADGNGIVVTTGQQPGLFGGPLYTWYKALTALALADELQRITGVPAAPVFWAATDDSDYAEARWTVVSQRGGARVLRSAVEVPEGMPMSRAPLGDVAEEFALLRQSAGTASDSAHLHAVSSAYHSGSTVGNAYVSLLRGVLEPMGIAVLDASHPVLRKAAFPVLRRALREAPAVSAALHERGEQIRAQGFQPQVHEVPHLSLVFQESASIRGRVSLEQAEAVAARASDETLSSNVLLRPVLERSLLPTVAYVGGPAEIAYFAQVGAVSSALRLPHPYVVPRWSGTVMEDHVRSILDRYSLTVADLADPHAALNRLARNGVNADVLALLAEFRSRGSSAFDRLSQLLTDGEESLLDSPRVVEGARAAVLQRLSRFERRIVAAAKRRDTKMTEDIATARGALFPVGKRQERALNVFPLLARYGTDFLEDVRASAALHAAQVVAGAGASLERSAAGHAGLEDT